MTLPAFKNFVSRDGWRARPAASGVAFTPAKVRGLAAHYEAAEESDDHSLCGDKVRGIQTYHMVTRRWSDIAYNYIVCGHGYLYEGRSWNYRGAANGSYETNMSHPSVCLLADDDPDEAEFTAAAQYAFRWLYWRCLEKFGDDANEFRPHSDFRSTTCPGGEVRRWLAAGAYRTPLLAVREHVVAAGETLWSIAQRYYSDGARCTELRDANHLKDDVIQPGQVLLIP